MSSGKAASLLALDTSTERLAVALRHAGRCWTVNEAGGALASARLLPAIESLLARGGCELKQLQAIAFGCGPGAFTGLRTSAAVAQGLALGAALPVLAVDSLMIVAEDARAQLFVDAAVDVAVCMDARMDEVYAGLYHWDGRRWQVKRAPALYTLPVLAAQGWAAQLLCGSALLAFGPRLGGLAEPTHRVESEHDRAAALLRVAEQLWLEGAAVDAALALPLYLRDKVAQTTLERDAVRAAKLQLESMP